MHPFRSIDETCCSAIHRADGRASLPSDLLAYAVRSQRIAHPFVCPDVRNTAPRTASLSDLPKAKQ